MKAYSYVFYGAVAAFALIAFAVGLTTFVV